MSPNEVLAEADRHFGAVLEQTESGERSRTFVGIIGRIALAVQAEGGHYTLVTVSTDQPGESEADKLAKRFLAVVHTHKHAEHEVRGAY
ncbi:MAG: hypothetical protein PVF27_09905 [Gemmatimonadales bacterium]